MSLGSTRSRVVEGRSRLNRAVVSRPWMTIVLFAAVTAVLAIRIPGLRIDTDIRSMMPDDHPVFLYNTWVEDYFGVEDPALVLIVNDGPEGVFTPRTLALVDYVSGQMAALDSINGDDLVSLSAVDNITGDGDTLYVEPFFEDPPTTQSRSQAIRDAVFENPMMVGSVVSRNGHATAIIGEIYEGYDREALYKDLLEIVARAPIGEERVLVAGQPVVQGQLGMMTRRDLLFMFPFVLGATGVVLFAALGCVRAVIIPLLVVVTSVVWTLGLMGWTDSTVFPISSIMPVLLVAIGVADGIHIIHRYLLGVAHAPNRPAPDTVFETMEDMTRPVVMTSVTTAAGIASLAVSSMRPVQSFGLFTSAGVLAALVFSLTILPAMLCVLPLPKRAARRTLRAQTQRRGVVSAFLNTLTPAITRYPLPIMSAAVIVVVLAVCAIPQIVVDGSMLHNFPVSNPVKEADAEFVAHFGGSMPMQIVLDGGRVDAWKEPELLRAVEGLQAHIHAGDYAGETRSITDYVTRMNAVMNSAEPGADRVPDSKDLVAQYLLLYEMSGDPGDFDDVVDYDYKLANVRAQLSSDHSPLAARVLAHVESYAAENLAPLGIKTTVSGTARIVSTFLDLLIEGQVRSLLLALLLIACLTAWMCGSVMGGLLTVLPVAVATALNFGLLGWSGEPLGVTTALMSSMALGIGVDYAIHFVLRYQRTRQEGLAPEAAMRETLSTSGVAIFYNALVVLAGFLVLTTSEFPVNRVLGTLVSFNMLVCFLATVTVLAAALHRFQPAFVRPEAQEIAVVGTSEAA